MNKLIMYTIRSITRLYLLRFNSELLNHPFIILECYCIFKLSNDLAGIQLLEHTSLIHLFPSNYIFNYIIKNANDNSNHSWNYSKNYSREEKIERKVKKTEELNWSTVQKNFTKDTTFHKFWDDKLFATHCALWQNWAFSARATRIPREFRSPWEPRA